MRPATIPKPAPATRPVSGGREYVYGQTTTDERQKNGDRTPAPPPKKSNHARLKTITPSIYLRLSFCYSFFEPCRFVYV